MAHISVTKGIRTVVRVVLTLPLEEAEELHEVLERADLCPTLSKTQKSLANRLEAHLREELYPQIEGDIPF